MLIQAAKWAGVPPWELMGRPVVWLLSILEAMEVEQALMKQSQPKPKSTDT